MNLIEIQIFLKIDLNEKKKKRKKVKGHNRIMIRRRASRFINRKIFSCKSNQYRIHQI